MDSLPTLIDYRAQLKMCFPDEQCNFVLGVFYIGSEQERLRGCAGEGRSSLGLREQSVGLHRNLEVQVPVLGTNRRRVRNLLAGESKGMAEESASEVKRWLQGRMLQSRPEYIATRK